MKFVSSFLKSENINEGFECDSKYLQVNCAGYYELDEIYPPSNREKGRNDFLFAYIHSGKTLVRSSGKDYEIGGGSIFLFKPHEQQYFFHIFENETTICYWVHFTGFGASELLETISSSGKNVFFVSINDEIPTIIKMILNELQEKKYNFESFCASLLMQLVAITSRKIALNKPDNKLGYTQTRITLTLNYIHTNYSKNIHITELAKLAGLCVNRYTNVFKKLTKHTPKEYIIKFRIQKAQELFKYTSFNVKQISSLVGFKDEFYFSRIFKKYEGISPSEYNISCKVL